MQWVGIGCFVWAVLGIVFAVGWSRFHRWLRGDYDIDVRELARDLLNDGEERFGNWRH